VKLVVNGSDMDVVDRLTVAGLVERVAPGRGPRGTAVALNGEVVPRGEWEMVTFSSGDRVEVLHAIGGG
jgi:sulfur carrier protein